MPLAAALLGLGFRIRPPLRNAGPARILDLSLLALLAAMAVQLLPLPTAVVSLAFPARLEYEGATRLAGPPPGLLPLALDASDTVHALTAGFCAFGTCAIARTLFARGSIRIVVTGLAWTAVAFVLVALAQGAAQTPLVYGFWQPYGTGARPLGPFINRNHGGTWSLLALMLCLGCLQWRRSAASAPAPSWRGRLIRSIDGRTLILALAVVLLVVNIGVSASRSAMVALACGAAYVVWESTRERDGQRIRRWIGLLGVVAALALLAYADVDRLLARIDQTRRVGCSTRVVIWRDAFAVIRDFPLVGVGAGNFANAMRTYQSSDRTYFWNEAHNHYVQVAAEGGVLLAAPATAAIGCLVLCAWRQLRRRDDPLHWMRVGACAALLAAAIQAIWETGLTLPANGMLAAVAAAILVHEPAVAAHAAARN